MPSPEMHYNLSIFFARRIDKKYRAMEKLGIAALWMFCALSRMYTCQKFVIAYIAFRICSILLNKWVFSAAYRDMDGYSSKKRAEELAWVFVSGAMPICHENLHGRMAFAA